ncbi:hypothetical protein, partial [Prevotella disiens]|uniref:hypothetical protein n=1 Tax=Prevotella disiens TaxID=28130 RepID=UPI001E49896A
VQILFCSFVCFVWLNEIVLFEQTEKNRQTLIFAHLRLLVLIMQTFAQLYPIILLEKSFLAKSFCIFAETQ